MDVHVRSAVTQGLRMRGVDVLTAQEDGTAQLSDPDLQNRSTALGRVPFTQDKDFLRETARRQQTGKAFAGVVYAHQQTVTSGVCVRDLELMAKVYDLEDMLNRVEYLPL
jgi:hypothetical protein